MSASSSGPALAPCPCGRRDRNGLLLPYAQCCGRYVDDFEHTPAPDAESLMRSRYTAFVRERADYLLATWHVSTRPATLDFEPGVKWLGLDVRTHSPRDADHAEVEFVARQRGRSGAAVRLHERSRFVREPDGELNRWYYLDGDLR
ncbi:SEC-C motif-containing protein [Variovorax sp. HW608]|uniref:YchJ family protein n=1 Tax=Variovorax sp. HW608 TaxID=1034889 RepID=UPI00081FA0D5|nr:YchJ family metal-binding protein [Variovorax sp. HW608]SCK40861.1 SEC-C motif-containing protein [Variovorax sp. HW608]